MKLPHRRQLLHLAAGAAALTVVSRIARAQAYPVRPVKIVVSFAAGGPTDILGRLTAQWLSERLDQQFVVENRPGGGGNIGAEAVVRSAPDGYTLLMIDATPTINATLYDKLNFDVARDLAAVAAVAQQPQMMIVHPSVPAKTVPEFIAYAKADAGKINMASGGTGTPPHMAGELFKLMAGIDLLCPLPGHWGCVCRSAWRPGTSCLLWAGLRDGARQERHIARTGGYGKQAFGRSAGHSGRGRIPAWL